MRPQQTKSPIRALAVTFALIALGVGLLRFDRRGGAPGPVGSAVMAAVSPLQSVAAGAGRSVRGLWLDYVALLDVRTESRGLQEELRKLQDRVARVAELESENERLRALLELGDRRKDLRLRAARVVSRTTSPYFRVLRVVLDSGDKPVEPGMPVIAPGGVVGQVRATAGGRAEVLLVTDPRSAIDVVLEQSRARGVAVGTGEPDRYAAKLEYLERSASAVVGERVLTTGDDDRYPRGLVVGEVVEVDQGDPGPFLPARIRPLVDLSALDEAFVVLGQTGLTPDGGDFEKPPKPQREAPAP